MTSVRPDDLLRLLRSGDAARPRLIWHAPGERIELSGRVLATWAAKAADLLQEDLDAGPSARVLLACPPHWRLAAWALGTWVVGATVATEDGDPGEFTVVVTAGDRANDFVSRGTDVVALTLAALARRSPIDLPSGVIDEAAVLNTYADDVEPFDRADDDALALVGSAEFTYTDLVGAGTDDRIHLSGSLPLDEVLRRACAAWAAGGSVVLTDPTWESAHGGDPAEGEFARVLATEGVSAPGG
ncbi:MAG: TIGR03089 family protein [Mobilicoccus sp.]|nr:TIGR03089 family protein [Mobilicoccus sp.]